MSIIKKFSAVVLALAVSTASADLIYWQIKDATGNQYAGENEGEKINFAYATISADGSYLNMYNDAGVKTESTLLGADATGYSTGAIYSGSFYDPVTSFLIELWNSDGARVGWQSYSKSAVAGSIWPEDTPGTSGGTPFVVSQVVPEPTSGLLLLVGLAGLALRRRRRA